MAHVYVDSNAVGAGTGADWANAYTTLAAALTAKAAGDNFWVAHNHAETQASAMTLTSPGTAANPCTVMCVTSAGTVPPVSADLRTTATVTTTGNNAMTTAGTMYVYGITFSCGTTAVAPSLTLCNTAGVQRFVACAIRHGGTSNSLITLGSATKNQLVWENTTFQVGAAGSRIDLTSCDFVWKGTASAVTGSTVPSNLFAGSAAARRNAVLVDGVDLSAITGNLVSGTSGVPTKFIFKDCKLASGVAVGTTDAPGGQETDIIRCDSGATNYRHERYRYTGTQTVETTIVRTGGASDGTTPISWKIVTTANSKWILPFESLPIAVWNDTTSANVTVTVYGFWDSASVPNNDDIWIEVSYLGASTSPLASIVSSTKADYLATGVACATDTSAWGGGDTTIPFKMQVTLSNPQPALKGALYVTVKAAKASSTFYIDPKIELS